MPFLLIILGVNATLAITRIFTGDTFHMDAIIIANVIGSLFAFMVYNVQRAQDWIKITPSSVSNWKRSRMINYRRN